MAVRRMAAADVPTIIAWWDTYKASLPEYVTEKGFTQADLTARLSDPKNVLLVDPATLTLAVGRIEGDAGHVILIFTRTAGTVAAVTAVDRMCEAVCQMAITAGLTSLYGEWPFAVDPETTKAVRYFNTLTPPFLKTTTPNANGTTTVRFESAPQPLLDALLVRTP